MSRALQPLFENGMPPPQQEHGRLPSPVTPSQSPQTPREREINCMHYLGDRMNHYHARNRDLEDAHRWDEEVIARQSKEIGSLKHDRAQLYSLRQAHEQLNRESQERELSHAQQLHQLVQKHADTLAQAVQEAELQVEQEWDETKRELEETKREVEELNNTFQQVSGEYKDELDTLNTNLSSLQEKSTEATATVGRLEATCSELSESNETLASSAIAQTTRIASLEAQLAAANAASEEAEDKLRSQAADLEARLETAEAKTITLANENEHLATQKAIHESNCKLAEKYWKLAEDAQIAAEEETAEVNKEVDALRKAIREFEEADSAAAELKKEVANTAQQHADRMKDMAKLNDDNQKLTVLVLLGQKAETVQAEELIEIKGHLEERTTELKDLRTRNEELDAVAGTFRKRISELDESLGVERKIVRELEGKREKECVSDIKRDGVVRFRPIARSADITQKQVKYLDGLLNTANKAVEAAEKKLEHSQSALHQTSAELNRESKAHQASRREITDAETNATMHFQAKQVADASLVHATRRSDDSISKIIDLEQQLEVSRKRPQEISRSLDETRRKLEMCGDDLQKSNVRVAQLEDENRVLQEYKSRAIRAAEDLVANSPSTKRARDSDSRGSDWSGDRCYPPAKRPRMDGDSTGGASRNSHDCSPYHDAPRGPRRQW